MGGGAHYPVLDLPFRARLSCVAWNTYLKSHLLAADYDGIATLVDASTGCEASVCHVSLTVPCILRWVGEGTHRVLLHLDDIRRTIERHSYLRWEALAFVLPNRASGTPILHQACPIISALCSLLAQYCQAASATSPLA